jgi:hypothetical protein
MTEEFYEKSTTWKAEGKKPQGTTRFRKVYGAVSEGIGRGHKALVRNKPFLENASHNVIFGFGSRNRNSPVRVKHKTKYVYKKIRTLVKHLARFIKLPQTSLGMPPSRENSN